MRPYISDGPFGSDRTCLFEFICQIFVLRADVTVELVSAFLGGHVAFDLDTQGRQALMPGSTLNHFQHLTVAIVTVLS